MKSTKYAALIPPIIAIGLLIASHIHIGTPEKLLLLSLQLITIVLLGFWTYASMKISSSFLVLGTNILTIAIGFFIITDFVLNMFKTIHHAILFFASLNIALILMSVGIARIVKSSEKTLETIRSLAETDSLTGLPNRRVLYDEIAALITSEQRSGAFLMLDLDNFKNLNDTYGHNFGDEVLKHFTAEVKNLLPEGVTLGRLGGDEFYIYCPQCIEKNASNVAEGIVKHFNRLHQVSQKTINLKVSIGISKYPDDGNDLIEIMKKADMALYEQKRLGKNGYRIFHNDIEKSHDPHGLQIEILKGIENDEYEVHYQPIMSGKDSKLIALEALIRWRRKGTLIPPLDFLGVAEYYDHIQAIDLHVLSLVCSDFKKLNKLGIRYISINLSARTIIQPEIVKAIQEIVSKHDIPFSALNFEITETAIIENYDITTDNINALRQLGAKVCLDDFCTGFSSLNHLGTLTVDAVKIDRSFVEGIGHDRKKEAIIKNLVNLGVDIDIDIIAEGVEVDQQIKFLNIIECQNLQGFYFGKPMPLEKIMHL